MVEKSKCIEQTEIDLSRSRERMIRLREEKGLTKNQLAKETDFSPTSINNWESGIKVPSYQNYVTLSHFYEVSFDYISGIEPGEYRQKRNVDIGEVTHLSEKAIENLLFEGSEHGDNTHVVMLDMILSNRELFTSLMRCLYSICYPPHVLIDLKNIPDAFIDKNNKDYLLLSPDLIKYITSTPESVFQMMKYKIEEFAKTVPERTIAPNEFHPF